MQHVFRRTCRLWVAFGLLAPVGVLGQDFLGYANSNYAGVMGSTLNPGYMLSSRYRLDIGLTGSFSLANDYFGFRREGFSNLGDAFNFTGEDANGRPIYEQYWEENWEEGGRRNVYASLNSGISVQTRVGKRGALGFSGRGRVLYALQDADALFLKAFLGQFDFEPGSPEANAIYSPVTVTIDAGGNPIVSPSVDELNYIETSGGTLRSLGFAEYSLSYAHTVLERGPHALIASGRVKYIQGVASAAFGADDLAIAVANKDLLLLRPGSNFNISYSQDFQLEELASQFGQNALPSLGYDVGFVYEWRPRLIDYQYNLDGKRNQLPQGEPMYKLRVGLAITDIGKVKWEDDLFSGTFTAPDLTDLTNFSSAQTANDFRDLLLAQIDTPPVERQSFELQLPTALNLQVDYHLYKGFYLGALVRQSLVGSDQFTTRVNDSYLFVPRYESRVFEASLPLLFDNLGNTTAGVSVRVGPVVVGSNSLLGTLLFSDGAIYNLDGYFGFRIGIGYKQVHDRDNDGVSNRYDTDDKAPGSWEHNGAPDTDGDHVPDSLDKCPNDPGLPEHNGCPDGR